MTPGENPILAVFGAGGFLLQMLPTLDVMRRAGHDVVIVDDKQVEPVFGYPVVPLDLVPIRASFVVAVANSRTREHIVERLLDRQFTRLVSPNTFVSPHAQMGEGAILCDHMVIEAGSRIGQHFQGNLYSYIAHECAIGDYVTFAPKVCCNGNVHIGDHAYIGTGAIIRQGTPDKPLRIGKRAVVGMGAVVTKDVPDDTTVIGNPARPR